MSPTTLKFKIFTGSPESGKVQQKDVEREVKPTDVVIKVTHSGLCYTDVHFLKQGNCLGHEGVGVVESVGSEVKSIKVGERVGFPYTRGACGLCDSCLKGEDMYCRNADRYGEPRSSFDLGGFASHAIVNEAFAVRIPEGLSNAHAGPLFCAGATVFEALYRYGVRAGDRVGVIGIGGLGHLAIQYAAKMGCEVVVFSGTDSKKEEAKSLGAHEFHATKGVKKFEGVRPLNHMLVTTSASPDWDLYFPVMAPQSTIFPLTVDVGGRMAFPVMPLVNRGMRVQGSCVAPRSVYNALLRFSALHGVQPMVQEFPMSVEGIERAFAALRKGELRYRAVLVAPEQPEQSKL